MGTGGGEFILSLNHPCKNTSVMEMWEPNVRLCKKRLEPLGIEVKRVVTDCELSFKDDSFHVISNRHSSFDIKEVKRVLKPNGIFITQQVGGKNNEKLSKVYFAKIIQWEFPNFSVDNCFEKLCKLNEEIQAKGYIESIEHRFIIVCRKSID